MCQVTDNKKATSYQNDYLDKLEITSESNLGKRQKRKAITTAVSYQLLQLNSPLYKEYLASLTCSNTVELKADGTTRALYCKKRWCTVCNNIRQAELIEAYLPALKAMREPFLVTLTVPSVKGFQISDTLTSMKETFTRIKDRIKKQGYRFNGIRKVEINYNEARDTYNPHYHIILDGADTSVQLVQNWLRDNPECDRKAQHISEADKNSLKELFKYQAKVVINSKFNAVATDTIMRALKGVRTFQNFGDVKKASVKFDSEEGEVIIVDSDGKPLEAENESQVIGYYRWHSDNWYSIDGEALVDAELPDKLVNLIEHIRGKP